MRSPHFSDILIPSLVGAILLMIPAFINGYPIVYSDTGTYLASAFLLETPFDRPITYGLFIRLASVNGMSLWGVIFLQSWIISWLICLTVKNYFSGVRSRHLILLFISLALITTISWTTSQLMPDIFTAAMMLSAGLLLFFKQSKGVTIFLYFLFALSTAMHMSHISMNVVVLLSMLVLKLFQIRSVRPGSYRVPTVLLLLVVTLAGIVTMGSALSKSRHAFFMGAMVEHGIAKAYLERHCDEKEFALCLYKDSLNMRAYEFVWDSSSPFYKLGGFKGTREEFNQIISGTLTEPEFIWMHIRESIRASVQQCFRFDVGDGNGVFADGSPLADRVKEFFPGEYSRYLHTCQNRNGWILLSGWNLYNFLIVTLSALIILSYLILTVLLGKRMMLGKPKPLIIFLLFFVIINMWSAATFANAIPRLGSKVIWIIPLLASWCLVEFMKLKSQLSRQA